MYCTPIVQNLPLNGSQMSLPCYVFYLGIYSCQAFLPTCENSICLALEIFYMFFGNLNKVITLVIYLQVVLTCVVS